VSGDTFKTEIDPVAAAGFLLVFEKFRKQLSVFLFRRYAVGNAFSLLCDKWGEQKLRAAIEAKVRGLCQAAGDFTHLDEAIEGEWRYVKSLSRDYLDPEISKTLTGCGNVTVAVVFGDLRGDEEYSVDLVKFLYDDYEKINAQLIALGRRLVDLREQMGERTFREAFRKRFPNIPFQIAVHFMDWALVEESKNEW
jgi:hypothetical protein